MKIGSLLRASFVALALGVSACSGGSDIASPGATNPGGGAGGGGSGGGGGGSGGTASCPTGTTNQGALGSNTICQIAGEILADLTLPKSAGVVYRINGRVDIGRDRGANGAGGQAATLTVQPGVTLFGTVAGDMMIVNRGSQIVANGTAAEPIIFTSDKDILGQNDPSTSNRQWGGLIVLGRAPIRGCLTAVAAGTESCQDETEGVTNATGRPALYGGATPTDTSGSLKYVQIRYPGAFLTSAAAGDDLNGLTLGGVGSGTTVDYLQVHNSGDDGVEVFGGTVNLKHVVLTGELDDSLDCDSGWTGNAQFMVVKQTSITGGPDGLVECSNVSKSSSGGSVQTRPTIANFTFIGLPSSSSGGALKGIGIDAAAGSPGASGRFYNGVVVGSTRCLSVTEPETGTGRGAADTGNPVVFSSVLLDCAGWTPSAAAQTIINAGTNNSTATSNTLVSGGLFPGANEQTRPAFNVTSINAFFEAANYIGAFSSAETAANNWAAGWTIQLLPNAGCPAGTTTAAAQLSGRPRCVLQGTLGQAGVPASVRLVAGNYYEISGRVDVGVDRGGNGAGGVEGTLTIDPGVTLFGNDAGDMLIINRGSKIFANGTATAPIILTSFRDITGSTSTTANREWGGLIVLGRAPIRGCLTAVASGSVDCQDETEGVTNATGRPALYGGATAADNSGSIKYVQVRYPGAFLTSAAAGDDLNGVTLGGVGSATAIDFLQVHNSGDDGIEIFGGTVGLKHVLITGALDDSLDCDSGWTGNMQFLVVIQRALAGGPDGLVECSNIAKSASGGAIQTRPTITNFTLVGLPSSSAGGNLKGIGLDAAAGSPGASGRFANGVVTGAARCLSVTEPETGTGRGAADTANPPTFNSVLLDCTGWTPSAAAQAIINAGANNSTATLNTLAQPSAPSVTPTAFVAATPGPYAGYPLRYVNGANETARTAVDVTTLGAFFTAAPYIGAVRNSTDNWWRAWSCGLETANC